ncbi:hypothetical protein Cni_G19287 [Canna indica]|uniref:Zinc knuckle CX2CX4HX4C domain-containing protein n=1 Tax=Canna indica TaxID=4628 RepID=A0AAQ3QJK9_9LILI|nr:hypothetical protein Cni_G19287 [Canna indica]
MALLGLRSSVRALGKVISIDQRSFEFSRGRFIRVCIEIDLNLPLKQGLWVGESDREFFQPLSYENLPSVCFACDLIGHREVDCPSKEAAEASKASVSPNDFSFASSSNAFVSASFVSSVVSMSNDRSSVLMNSMGGGVADPVHNPLVGGQPPPSVQGVLSMSACGPWILVTR